MNRPIEMLENDVRFSEYRIDVLLRAGDAHLVSALRERIGREKEILRYMYRAQNTVN